MKKGLLFVLFLISFVGFGQCPTENIYLNNQAQVDAFVVNYPNCTQITEAITISGSDITNLTGLNVITAVGGILNIQGNPLLQNLSGLENLTQIETFWIKNNINFTSFDGLSSLILIGTFEVGFLDNLVNMNGLENVQTITNNLKITHNNSLLSLSGLEGLTSVNESVRLFMNPMLTSIAGLRNINAGSFDINSNFALSQCAIQPVCEQIGLDPGIVFISGNAPGCNSTAEVEAQCQLLITEADLSQNLSLFPNPVSSILNIETSNNILFEKAIVYSTLGTLIFETIEKQLNLETLSAGVYFAEVLTNKGSVAKKIVKE